MYTKKSTYDISGDDQLIKCCFSLYFWKERKFLIILKVSINKTIDFRKQILKVDVIFHANNLVTKTINKQIYNYI